jgi:hypothetical protein
MQLPKQVSKRVVPSGWMALVNVVPHRRAILCYGDVMPYLVRTRKTETVKPHGLGRKRVSHRG